MTSAFARPVILRANEQYPNIWRRKHGEPRWTHTDHVGICKPYCSDAWFCGDVVAGYNSTSISSCFVAIVVVRRLFLTCYVFRSNPSFNTMFWKSLAAIAAITAGVDAGAMLRFSCSQLVVERLDPLVNPGQMPSPHLHQVVGGNAFNVTMDQTNLDIPSTATCTTCTPAEDFSNYWTATLFFRAKNGTFKAVKTKGNPLGFTGANGGQTVYYLGPQGNTKITAFKPGFRMTVGDPAFRTAEQLKKYPMLTYTCLQTSTTRGGETTDFPKKPCKVGIMVNIRFPTCWDGKNLDSPDHQSHTA